MYRNKSKEDLEIARARRRFEKWAYRQRWEIRDQLRGVAQLGSAPALGAGGRRFESGRPDHSHEECVGDGSE